jgi:hypothetical protein
MSGLTLVGRQRIALCGEEARCLCSNIASGGDQDHVDASLAVEM